MDGNLTSPYRINGNEITLKLSPRAPVLSTTNARCAAIYTFSQLVHISHAQLFHTVVALMPDFRVQPAWPDQGMPHPLPWSPPPGALRPFSSPCDHLGRPMSREVLSRATASLKPQQFDTTQRRCQYTGALAAKREARLSREAADAAAAQLVRIAMGMTHRASTQAMQQAGKSIGTRDPTIGEGCL